MTSYDNTHLERQLSSLFSAEAAGANLPPETWQAIAPKIGEPDRRSLIAVVRDSISFPIWRNPMQIRYVAPTLTVLLAVLIAFIFVVLLNNPDDDEGTPAPASSPTVPAPTPDLEATVNAAGLSATATAEARATASSVPATASPTGPTPTATASVEFGTPGITPPPPTPLPPMQVVFPGGFGAAAEGTAFEDLLAQLPDNEITRTYVKLSDFAGTLQVLGLERLQPGASVEETEAFLQELVQPDLGGFSGTVPGWPEFGLDYATQITEWQQNAGFDIWSVEQSAVAEDMYTHQDDRTGPSLRYRVAFGQFDPMVTANSLAACDCDQPDIRSHEGIEFFSWGEEGIGEIQKRFAPPLYDHIGRGPRLYVSDGLAYWTVFDAGMEHLIEVSEGLQTSLADSPEYIDAVRLMTTLGSIRDMTIQSDGLSIDELDANVFSPDPGYRDAALAAPLLLPFEFAAESVGFDGERAFTGLVIGHVDGSTANINSGRLVERMRAVQRQPRGSGVWADRIERVEISVEGSNVLARVYFHDRQASSIGFPILQLETLVVHE